MEARREDRHHYGRDDSKETITNNNQKILGPEGTGPMVKAGRGTSGPRNGVGRT